MFIPFNPSGVHWVLIVLDIVNASIILLDPLYKEVSSRLYALKFNKNVGITTTVDHTKLSDMISCGVLCCYYAHQISSGNFKEDILHCAKS